MVQLGGRIALASMGDPQVGTGINGTTGRRPGLGLGADADEPEQHPLLLLLARVTQMLTSGRVCRAWAAGVPSGVQGLKKIIVKEALNFPVRRKGRKAAVPGLWVCAARKASELRMIKTRWYGDLRSICSGLGAAVPRGAAGVGTAGVSRRVMSRSGTKPSPGHVHRLSQRRQGCGWKWCFFTAALMLGDMRD